MRLISLLIRYFWHLKDYR